jgi:hypothetical protein
MWENPKLDWKTNPHNPIKDDFNRIEGNIDFLKTDIETKKGAIVDALNDVGIFAALADTHAQLAGKIMAAEKTGIVLTPGMADVPIPKGIYDIGGGKVIGDSNLKSSNILIGKSIFGVEGSAGNSVHGCQKYTTPGLYSSTVPDGVTSLYLYIVGAGGGGGGGRRYDNRGSGGGGGAGGTYIDVVSVTPGQTFNVQVGAGGAGGISDNTNPTGGSSGEDSCVGSYIAYGGKGGKAGQHSAGGAGGAGGNGGGIAGFKGADGLTGVYNSDDQGSLTGTYMGIPGPNPGSGGNGVLYGTATNGADGIVIITY